MKGTRRSLVWAKNPPSLVPSVRRTTSAISPLTLHDGGGARTTGSNRRADAGSRSGQPAISSYQPIKPVVWRHKRTLILGGARLQSITHRVLAAGSSSDNCSRRKIGGGPRLRRRRAWVRAQSFGVAAVAPPPRRPQRLPRLSAHSPSPSGDAGFCGPARVHL